MKKILLISAFLLLIIVLLVTFVQLDNHARQAKMEAMLVKAKYQMALSKREVSEQLLGYWEGKEKGVYFYKNAFIRFNLPSSGSTNRDAEIFSYTGNSFRGDTMLVNIFNENTRKESITAFKIIDDQHIRALEFSQDWPIFTKKEPDLFALLSIFEILNEYSDGTMQSALEFQESFERLDFVPKEIQNCYKENKPASRKYCLFEKEIHENTKIFTITEIYKNADKYLLIAPNDPRSPRAFLINRSEMDTKELKIKKYSFHNNSQHAERPEHFLQSGQQLTLEDLPEPFFDKYFPYDVPFFNYSLNSYVQLLRESKIFMNGKYWNVNKVYSFEANKSEIQESPEGPYYLNFEVENQDYGITKIIRASAFEGNFKFETVAEDFFSYDDIWRALFNIFLQLLALAAFLGILIFFVHRLFILPRKLKQRLSEVHMEGVKAQLNPHFLFNSMASIQSLMNQEKIPEANRYLSELSDLLRYHLDTSTEDRVLLSEELAALQHYCELENLRSPFEMEVEVEASIDPDSMEIPTQLLQPLIENAVKHGLRYVEKPKLVIQVQRRENSIAIAVIDNGPGIYSEEEGVWEKIPTLRKTHKGLPLIREKIALLASKGIKLHLQITDRQKDLNQRESGTQVLLEVPLSY